MIELAFREDWIQWLADHRFQPLTASMQGFTYLGELEGMVVLVAFVHAVHDKRLAVRLAVVTLLAMMANHLLKTAIRNPRPFVAAGTWADGWATTPGRAAELVTEFSTPSGHAMAGAAFWGVLWASLRERWMRVACVVAILGTGLSRPYLGVHYVEDVLLGWPLGLVFAFATVRFGDAIGARWSALPVGRRVAIAVAASAGLWAATRGLGGAGTVGQPSAFVSYAGFLTGIAAAVPLEAAHVRFDPRSGPPLHKLVRFVLGFAALLGTLALLDAPFAAIAADATPLGDLLRYVRYAGAAWVGLFLVPLVAVRCGLAARLPDREPDAG